MSTGSRDTDPEETRTGGSDVRVDEDKFGPREYLGYRIIRERENQDDLPTSRSKFWKLCCIADRNLVEQKGLDIGFPRHWYKYGEVGDVPSLDTDFINQPSARHWQGQEILSDREIPITEFEVSTAEREVIDRTAKETVSAHGKKSAEELKSYQYTNHVDDPFIDAYTQLRAQFEAVDLDQQHLITKWQDEPGDPVEHYLDQMLVSYPEEREYYSDVFGAYLDWDDTFRLMYEEDYPASQLKSFLEFFVEKLSESTLRLVYNHGIPESRLADWEEERDDVIEELENGVEETRAELLDGREVPEVLKTVSDSFSGVIVEEMDEIPPREGD